MKERALLRIIVLRRKLIKKSYLIYVQVWKPVATKIRQLNISLQESLQDLDIHAVQHIHHYEISLDRKATCAAHRSHSSTVATSILTVERQTDF